ncbi:MULTISPECIES: peptidoglycan-binding domain-containing protein [Rhizobium]|uniref:Peptidoglycan binding-like domain-containing protein n=2 Tax=Rhizobium TaxID=379 RepID=A0A109JHX5_9HYPH|nr:MULTISPECIES: peptidoglycan-binding domain-containing protein [Rhizobium]KWV49049.1 hypothetical protein AS026_11760 [Rhizobium altiplani]KWV49159.1 hypothetical protein AS026_11385 [Rhizobium altiplani]KWV58848.1 hypothetical protein AS026_29700 [Rhizobium altiplani]CCM80158.1 exported hypothetical protein [Rhizobium mesoamericanum STM3625]
MIFQASYAAVLAACIFCTMSAGAALAEIRPVRDVQKALAEQGYDAGTPDGIWGTKSVAALKGFQRAHGLAPSGVVTQDSLKALFSFSVAETEPTVTPRATAAAPAASSVALQSDVSSAEPATSSQQTPRTPNETASKEPSSKRADHSGYVVVIVLLVIGFVFARRRTRKAPRAGRRMRSS